MSSKLEKRVRRLRGYIDRLSTLISGFEETCCSASDQLSAQELRAVEYLSHGGPARMKDLAAHLGLAANSVTSLVDNLNAKGLAVRKRSSQDRRVVRVELSQEGGRIARTQEEALMGFCKEMLRPLSAQDQESLLELFAKMTRDR